MSPAFQEIPWAVRLQGMGALVSFAGSDSSCVQSKTWNSSVPFFMDLVVRSVLPHNSINT